MEVVGALLVWLAVSTCGEAASPTSPESGAPAVGPASSEALSPPAGDLATPTPQFPLGFSTNRVLTFLVPPSLTDPRHAEKLISAAQGGFVELDGFRVDIPKGALAEDTVITLDLPTTLPAANYVVADFGPTGLTFNKSVRITMPLLGVDLVDVNLDEVRIWYWNGSRWREPRGTATTTSVTSRTTHFSTYGARKGIDTTSGG
jgi:hypothetical protein